MIFLWTSLLGHWYRLEWSNSRRCRTLSLRILQSDNINSIWSYSCFSSIRVLYDGRSTSRHLDVSEIWWLEPDQQTSSEHLGYSWSLSTGHDLSGMGLRYDADLFCLRWNKQWKNLRLCSCSGEDIHTRLHFTLFLLAERLYRKDDKEQQGAHTERSLSLPSIVLHLQRRTSH